MNWVVLHLSGSRTLRYYFSAAIVIVFSVGFVTISAGQDRCGTVEYIKKLREKNLIRENDKKFEQWLRRRQQNVGSRTSAVSIFRIPVVVHVIHNGEAVGSGANISDAQILSQIKVLNSDFKRLNADTTNTPADFSPFAGKINMEFVLARQSPQGTATTGIVRVKGSKRQWSLDDNNTLKALSYWPAENYLNIWVTDIASTIMGYAQFPVSDLPGLEDAEDNRLTDGVVLDYRIVGSSEDGSFNLTTSFNKGRTATHEVGHFFGLRHIWGDDAGACDGEGDYVSDTPDQGNNTTGCPTHPQMSCSEKAMFQNYMDYTNDVCMNLYTKQQVERMLTILENSPRRTSLLTSDGLYEPGLVDNDLAIGDISSPSANECMGNVIPEITVVNKGLNNITSTKIQLRVNDDIVETKYISFQSLPPQSTAVISFSSASLSGGDNDVEFEIIETNGADDGKSNDNFKSFTSVIPYQISTPFSESFNSLPQTWNISNADGETTWSLAQAGTDRELSNKAIYLNFFGSQSETNEKDIMTTPVMDLSQATSPFLAFDVAYGRYQQRSDGLEIYILLDCDQDLAETNKIYSKYGSSLATVSSTTTPFSPLNETQWRREVIDLRQFIGQAHVQFAFVGVNGKGNNLFVDNIAVRADVSENIALRKINHPSPVHCSTEVEPLLLLENKGSAPIVSLDVIYVVNDEASQTFSVTDFNLLPGAQASIKLPSMSLDEGENKLLFRLANPNGFGDVDITDNQLQFITIVNDERDKIPLRHNFDEDQPESAWLIVNPGGQSNWQVTQTNYNNSLSFTLDMEGTDEDASWLVSPVLDFSQATTASLFFDYAFRYKNMDSIKDPGEEVFKVLGSRDCGQTFEEILLSANANLLSENTSIGDGLPASSSDWKRQYINLSDLAGETAVRIALVVSNAISGSLYVDNIEFFLSDDPTPFASTELYTLYPNKIESVKSFYVTFNLSGRQTVAYELIDMQGKQVGSKELTDVLNQTYKIDVENASNGVYLVRLLIDKKYHISRIVIVQ